MKKFYALPLFVFSFLFGFSQQPIQLDSADMPYIGFKQRIARDTFPLPAANYGSKGANKVYDFSNFTLFGYDTIECRALTSSQLSKFPNSKIATTQDGKSFLFSKTTSSNITWQGLDGEVMPGFSTDVTFSPEPIVAKFPTKYGNTYSGTWGFTKTVAGSAVGQPSVNQVRVTYTGKYTDTIDGWGKVITPFTQYKCLRDQRYESSNTKIEISFIPNIFSNFSNTYDTTKRYTYLTKETKGSALTFSYDTSGALSQAAWSMILPNAPLAGFKYSVSTNGLVTFTDTSDNLPKTWSWNFGDGSQSSTSQNPSHAYTANGKYYVCLTVTNDGGSDVFCDSVRVTTIGATNNKPTAKNDSASVEQPNTVLVNVLANDTDPDQNALVVSVVKLPNHGTVSVTSNKVYYSPDSAFVGFDTLQYKICDNGSPSLCDTAYVFIEVKEQIILPIASFIDSMTCGQGFYTSTSQNADSVVWKLTSGMNISDTIASGNQLFLKTNDLTFGGNLCLYAYNKFGVDSSCRQFTFSCLGINEVEEDISYKIFPNPSSGYFYVKNNLPFLMGVKTIRLIDLGGRIVSETAVNENNAYAVVETSNLQAGSYIAEVVLINNKVGGRLKVMVQ
ncbi:MAG TPA: PKD domain-containing protein [Chitinophagales bacterium]|nr:PKD domain-containing protein [Chitinophagales bacterium]